MGLFKTTVSALFGPTSPRARSVLDAADDVRRRWSDPMLVRPVPLLDPDRSLLVLWSAKSACSLTFVWYLRTIGLLDHYAASGLQPHAYRGRHYLNSDAFRRGKQKLIDDYRIVHVIRDPCLRAVSSYRHVLATGLADKRLRLLGAHPPNSRDGFSFNRYLDFLETLDLARTNVHHRLQLHPIERIKPADRVINISKGQFLRELNRLEEDYGIPPTDFGSLDWVLGSEERRRAKTTTFSGQSVADLPLTMSAARGRAPWPDYEQFLDASARPRIERLYAPDFEAFGAHL